MSNFLKGKKISGEGKIAEEYTFFPLEQICAIFYIENGDETEIYIGLEEDGYLSFNQEEYYHFESLSDLIYYNKNYFSKYEKLYYYKNIATFNNVEIIKRMCIDIDFAQDDWEFKMNNNVLVF